MTSDKSSGYETNSHNSTYNPGYTWYPHPFADPKAGFTPSYRYRYLRSFSSVVRSTPNWITESRDRKTFVQWLQRAHKQDFNHYDKRLLAWNAEDVEFAWKELSVYRDYVEMLRGEGCYIEPDIDGVWRADDIISEEARKDLIDAVATLENDPDRRTNWRRRWNEKILDLVDPSLWPVIYGQTLDQTTGELLQVTPDAFRIPFCFRQMGVTEIHPSISTESQLKLGYSARFCWLPSEFKVSKDGKETKISSYINNLSSPEEQKLFYPIIEKIFTRFIPLFNHVLADLVRGRYYAARTPGCNRLTQGPGLTNQAILKADYFKKFKEILKEFQNEEEPTVKYEDSALEVCHSHHKCQKRKFDCGKIGNRRVAVPIPSVEPLLDPREMWQPPKIARARRLEGRTLKVVLKFTNIVLTPDKPSYTEPYNWDLEPMLNESIVATGVYYYSQENITETRLKFEILKQEKGLPACQCGIGGFTRDAALWVDTKVGRAIVFPNMILHKTQSFELVDKSKPGHQKMLIFYLCDPSRLHNMPTTRIVAPQQPDARPELVNQLREGPLGALPEEVFQMIIEQLPAPISREEAIEYRQELQNEKWDLY